MNIIYTGAFRFPRGDAAANRVLMISKAIKEAGEGVMVIGWGGIGSGFIDNIFYENTNELNDSANKKNIFLRLFDFLTMGKLAFIKIMNICKDRKNIDVVIAYNPSSFFSMLIILFCKLNNIKALLDTTEWYESAHLKGGKYGLRSIENAFRMRVFYKFFDGYICISEFLLNYFSRCGKPCILVPALVDKVDCNKSYFNENCISMIFAGNAGKKDNIEFILKNVIIFNRESKDRKISIDFYGPSSKEINAILEKIFKKLNSEDLNFLKMHGRVSSDEVYAAYKKSNFSFIFRENLRYAIAGFPTKSVESWSNGVPIITNGIGDFLNFCNEKNSLVVDIKEPNKLFDFFTTLNSEKYEEMKSCSLNTARNNFLYKNYISALRDFLNNRL